MEKPEENKKIIPMKVGKSNNGESFGYMPIVPKEPADNNKSFERYNPNDNVPRETGNFIRLNPKDKLIIISNSGYYGDEFIIRCDEQGCLSGENYFP